MAFCFWTYGKNNNYLVNFWILKTKYITIYTNINIKCFSVLRYSNLPWVFLLQGFLSSNDLCYPKTKKNSPYIVPNDPTYKWNTKYSNIIIIGHLNQEAWIFQKCFFFCYTHLFGVPHLHPVHGFAKAGFGAGVGTIGAGLQVTWHWNPFPWNLFFIKKFCIGLFSYKLITTITTGCFMPQK